MDTANDAKMPFTSHLEELRSRLIRIVAAIGIGFVVSYSFKELLFKVLTRPLVQALPAGNSLIYTGSRRLSLLYEDCLFFVSFFDESLYPVSNLEIHRSRSLSRREKICHSLCPGLHHPVFRRFVFWIFPRVAAGLQILCILQHRFPQADVVF